MPDKLIKGAQEFKDEQFASDDGVLPTLAKEGQNPRNFIISCIDSRCNPGTIFKAAPGSFFSHKAMGAIVRPYQKGTALAAALQFALNYNHVENIIVLGHTGCGAVKALIDDLDDEEIKPFVNTAQTALKRAREKEAEQGIQACAEEETILTSVENLKSYPSVKKAVDEQRITLQAWKYDISSGNLFIYDEARAAFTNVMHH